MRDRIVCRTIGAALVMFLVCLIGARAVGQTFILDNFSGNSGDPLDGQAPDTTNLPGGAWQVVGVGPSAAYQGNNQAAVTAINGGIALPTSGNNFTPGPVMTLSAGVQVGTDSSDNGDPAVYRGIGLGYFSSALPNGQNAVNTGAFACVAIDYRGSVDLYESTPTANESLPVVVQWPTATLGDFSTSTTYTVSYSVNTATGQISNVSVSNGNVTDTSDFTPIDSYDTTGVFTVDNTAYAGVIMSSGGSATGIVSQFQLSNGASAPTGSAWTGAVDTTWSNAGNWSGVVPGVAGATNANAANTDTALFNAYNAMNPTPVVDAGRNLQSIVFDNSGGLLTASLALGTSTGHALLLTSGGTIETTYSVANSQAVNAPLVIEGTGGAYTFSTGAVATSATLNFGGSITPGATSGTTTLTLAGSNTGANTISGAIADGAGSQMALAVTGGNWVLGATNTYTGSTTISGGALHVGSGASGSLGTSPIAITGGQLLLAPGGSIGNAAIAVSKAGAFVVQPGIGALSIGSTGTGSAGATLSLGAGAVFSMVDGAIGTFNLQQQNSFGSSNPALTLNGATLDFELANSNSDQLIVGKGQVLAGGVNSIGVTAIGSSLNSSGVYTIISAPAGGLTGGTFQFASGGPTTFVTVGGNAYQLTLNNSAIAETISVAPASIIYADTFSGSGFAAGQSPSPVNVPGAVYLRNGPNNDQDSRYTASIANGMLSLSTNVAAVLPIASYNNGGSAAGETNASYTLPASITISAKLQINNVDASVGTPPFRGLGLGFWHDLSNTRNANQTFFGATLQFNGTVALLTDDAGDGETVFASAAFPSALGTFSTSQFYTLAYTVNTVTGVISGVSLNGDTADYQALDGVAPGNGSVFTAPTMNYAGIVVSANFSQTGHAENFQILAAAPSTAANGWTGAADNTWANPGNWVGNVPGATSGTTNTDTAIFNQVATNSPTVIDAGRNMKNITFDTANVGQLVIGSTSGNPLLLTGGGELQMTASVVNQETIAAPLVIEGTGQTYTLADNATVTQAALIISGAITAGGNSGTTTLALAGKNTSGNAVNGSISDGGNGATIALAVQQGNWSLRGADSYSGGTTIASGAILQIVGSVSSLSPSMNVVNSGELLFGIANQKAGTITGSGAVAVEFGSLTAYEIVQRSLGIHGTAAATSTVTLVPSGSGSVSTPSGPNNINYSNTLASLSIDNSGTPLGSTIYYGTLDIGNNGLVIAYGSSPVDPFAAIEDMVRSGYDKGDWKRTGITSSLAAASTSSGPALNIGVVDFTPGNGAFANQTSITFEGQTITTNSVLVRLTYMDDITLTGDMSQHDSNNDAILFAANYGIGTTWGVGDLTHDGKISANDAVLFAANFSNSFATLDGTSGNAFAFGAAAAAVPEPAGLLLGASGAVGLLGLFRRRRCD